LRLALCAAPCAACARSCCAMVDWIALLLAVMVLVVPIGVGWMALKLSDRKAQRPRGDCP
jgi:hypothetical protein